MASRLTRPVGARADIDGAEGNERLTGWAGAVLFVLLAIEGVTILSIGSLIVPHIVVGMLLVGPVALKVASTGYRFVRYYAGAPAYQHKGPPRPLMRVLGPFVVVSTAAVLASGIALLYVPAGLRERTVQLHKASFLVWFALMALHVLAYASRVPRLVSADLFGRRRVAWARVALVLAALLAGAVLAAATVHLAQPWTDLRIDG